MKLPRRQFLHLAAAAATLPAVSNIALAVNYPTRPVHLVVGYPPGLAPDIIARLVGAPLSERLGRPVVIDNPPGAGSNLRTGLGPTATPERHPPRLIATACPLTSNPSLSITLDFRT